MKNQKLFYVLLMLPALLFGASAHAQYDWGDEPQKAKEAYARLADYTKAEQFEKARPDAAWLIEHAPKLHVSMYRFSIDVYEEMEEKAEKAKDKERQQEFQDTILLLYQRRLKYGFHKGEDDIYRYAGYKAYPFLLTRGNQEDTLYTFYNKVLETNGNNTPRAHLTYLMDVTGRMYSKGKITKEEFFKSYSKAQGVATHNVNKYKEKGNDKKAKKWQERCADKLDDLLTAYMKDDLDCQTVKDIFVAKAKAEPENQAAFDKALAWMIKADCTGDEDFLNLLIQKYERDQDCGSGKTVAKLYMANEDYEKAEEWYEKIFDGACADDAEGKGEAFLQLAKVKASSGQYGSARRYAQKAAAADESVASDAYTLIGDMYAGSFNRCGEAVKGDPVKVRAVFLAAYDMYARAGNTGKMNKMKEQFPSTEEVFTQNKKVGDSISVGCWIQTSTTIRTR